MTIRNGNPDLSGFQNLTGLIKIVPILGIFISINGCGKSGDQTQQFAAGEKEDKISVQANKEENKKNISDMTNNESITRQWRTVEIKTKGMSCSHCENSVKTEVGKLDGVKEVTADAKTNTAKVIYDTLKTDIKAIEHAIGEAGYEVVEVKQQ